MPELTAENNPYRANRPWPPDFDKLGHKHQFRLERKFRRRLRNASIKPNWIKGVKLAQFGACTGIFIFSVFFMDWTSFGYKPFEGIRAWARNTINVIGSPPPPSLRRIKDDSAEVSDPSQQR